MTINAETLERAIRQFWFRNPRYDGMRFISLPKYAQEVIVNEAIKMERE